MRKLFCWCAALTATGAIFVAFAAAFVTAHPTSYAGRLAMRAWCGKEQTPIVEQVAQIYPEPDMNDPAIFLGEPAVAQEFHKRLPLGVFAADQTEQNEAEEKEEARLFTNAHHNRLPGTILFSEEPQEPSTGTSKQPAGTDKPMPPATADSEAGEILPATTEGSGPQFMSYCVDEGDAKAEMPYAEEEEELNAFSQLGLTETTQRWSVGLLLNETPSYMFGITPPHSFAREEAEQTTTTQEFVAEEWPAKPLLLGNAIYLGNGPWIGGGINPMVWREFIGAPNIFKESKAGPSSPLSIHELLPFLNSSRISPLDPEMIDTIWPLNLLGQSFRGLLSLLDEDPNRRMTELTGPSGYPTRSDLNARLQELINQNEQSGPPGYETQSDPTKKRKDDKPGHLPPERVHGGIQ